ncbi:hypothetical protein Tco_0264924 [Tanacetum coccineum]
MNDPDITMEEYIQLEAEKACRRGQEFNWETATYGKIWYDEDVHYLRLFETEFPAIVYNDALASKPDFSSEPTISINMAYPGLGYGAYIVRNSLHYQDLEWYEALEDSELKDKALRNKSIMEGLISDDESSNYCWRRWKSHEITYHDHDEIEHENETHDERQELCEAHELPKMNTTIWQEKAMMHAEHTNKSFVEWTKDGWLRSPNKEKLKKRPLEINIDEYWWRIYKFGDLEVLES